MANILAVDDELNMREFIVDVLSREGHKVTQATDGKSAILLDAGMKFNLIILDLKLPGISGLETLRRLRQPPASSAEVIIITAYATVDSAIEALRAGACDFLIKPFEPGALRDSVRRALSETKAFSRAAGVEPVVDLKGIDSKKTGDTASHGIIGASGRLRDMLGKLDSVAGTDATVLITGETGAGKEVVARALHLSSRRRDGPFVSINCAALPDTLIENELFGHERGAYTDAKTRQNGKVKLADGGTLFLDEVGDLAPLAQAKLLRMIEEREYVPLGGTTPVKADVRIVSATHRNLSDMVTAGSFREDLYWRLRVIPIHIPPLRERGEKDVMELADHFMDEFSQKYGRPKIPFSEDNRRAMAQYSWPGNVRELRNYVERFLLIGDERPLPIQVSSHETGKSAERGLRKVHRNKPETPYEALKSEAQRNERDVIADAIRRAGGNKRIAAKTLGMSYRTLFNKIKKYGITVEVNVI